MAGQVGGAIWFQLDPQIVISRGNHAPHDLGYVELDAFAPGRASGNDRYVHHRAYVLRPVSAGDFPCVPGDTALHNVREYLADTDCLIICHAATTGARGVTEKHHLGADQCRSRQRAHVQRHLDHGALVGAPLDARSGVKVEAGIVAVVGVGRAFVDVRIIPGVVA